MLPAGRTRASQESPDVDLTLTRLEPVRMPGPSRPLLARSVREGGIAPGIALGPSERASARAAGGQGPTDGGPIGVTAAPSSGSGMLVTRAIARRPALARDRESAGHADRPGTLHGSLPLYRSGMVSETLARTRDSMASAAERSTPVVVPRSVEILIGSSGPPADDSVVASASQPAAALAVDRSASQSSSGAALDVFDGRGRGAALPTMLLALRSAVLPSPALHSGAVHSTASHSAARPSTELPSTDLPSTAMARPALMRAPQNRAVERPARPAPGRRGRVRAGAGGADSRRGRPGDGDPADRGRCCFERAADVGGGRGTRARRRDRSGCARRSGARGGRRAPD